MKRPEAVSALIYTSISLLTAGTFLAVTVAGDYTWVARLGGAAWVFGLSMIVSMPIVTPAVKKRMLGKQEQGS
mgnify:CR=1 FL=1